MASVTNRGALSRQQKKERIVVVRRDLSVFLDTLDPLLRKYLLNPKSLTLEEARQVWLQVSAERERQRQAALMAYERLLIQIPTEWHRHCSCQMPEFKPLREYILLGRVPRRGAPRKAPHEREASIVARLVDDAESRLKEGCKLRRHQKEAGGAASDNTEIKPRLRDLGYDDEACRAILETKSSLGAAVFFVACQLGKERSSIRSSIKRARDA